MNSPQSALKVNQKAPLQASKWLELRVLLDSDEMGQLCEHLLPFQIYLTGGVMKPGQGAVSHERFLKTYHDYVGCLQNGLLPEEETYRQLFSTLWTRQADHLAVTQVNETDYLIRPCLPVVQLRPHRFSYSPLDGQFRSMVLGRYSLSWGIQFAYPQIFQNPETQQIEQIKEEPRFPNTSLFRSLQRWVRQHTLPTPFGVGEKQVNVPIRIGMHCLKWINQHPQLAEHNLKVITKSS